METTKLNTKHLGWLRALIYAIGAFLIVIIFSKFGPVISTEVVNVTGNGEDSIIGFGILYTIMGIVVVLFTWLMRKFVDKKTFESLGFTWKGYNNEAALGLFAALAILGIGSLLLVATGNISFVSVNLDASPLMVELVIMVVVAFVEEVIFRGYLLNNLIQSMNKWIALIITFRTFSLLQS
jgi:membrane protease YdiL (CAAX protease family)